MAEQHYMCIFYDSNYRFFVNSNEKTHFNIMYFVKIYMACFLLSIAHPNLKEQEIQLQFEILC